MFQERDIKKINHLLSPTCNLLGKHIDRDILWPSIRVSCLARRDLGGLCCSQRGPLNTPLCLMNRHKLTIYDGM